MANLSTAFKTYDKVREKLNEGADTDRMTDDRTGLPKGLVPSRTFDGFYTSPGGDFDVTDCSNPRNATSPFCGYNPVSATPFDVGLSFKKTKCGILAQLAPTIGFIEFPPAHVAYVNEECREGLDDIPFKPVPQDIPGQPLPDVIPPSEQAYAFNPLCDYIVGLECNQKGQGGVTDETSTNGTFFYRFDILFGGAPLTFYSNARDAVEYQSDTLLRLRGLCFFPSGYPAYFSTAYQYSESKALYHVTGNTSEVVQIWTTPEAMKGYGKTVAYWLEKTFPYAYKRALGATQSVSIPTWRDENFMTPLDYPVDAKFGYQYPEWNKETYIMAPRSLRKYGKSACFYLASGAAIIDWLNSGTFKGENNDGSPNGVQYTVGFKQELKCDFSNKYRLPTDDCHPKPQEDCCDSQNANCYEEKDMGCCEDKNKDLLALLKKIDKKLGEFPKNVSVWDDDPNTRDRQKKSKSLTDIAASIEHLNQQLQNTLQLIGIEEFPIGYPESIVVPQSQNNLEKIWNWLNPKKERKIKNIAQLIDWGTDQSSAVLGQWQQYVEYDGKPDRKGKPTKEKVVLPDIATTLRELFKMLASNIQMNGLSTDIQAKNLATSTNNSIMLLEALETVKDMQLYMDYVSSQKSKKLPIQISPGESASNLKKYLQPSTVEVVYDEWQSANDDSLQEGIDSIRQTLVTVLAQLGGETN